MGSPPFLFWLTKICKFNRLFLLVKCRNFLPTRFCFHSTYQAFMKNVILSNCMFLYPHLHFHSLWSNQNTGSPRNLRTFYLWIRLFAVIKNIPKFSNRGKLALIPSLFRAFGMRLSIKLLKKWHFISIQCSLIICGFKICGSLVERI